MSPNTFTQQPKTILHLDQSRSGGHLLQRILSTQPRRTFLDHPFSQARGKQVQWLIGAAAHDEVKRMESDLRGQWKSEVTKGREMWEKAVREAGEKDKILMIQDHCFNSASPETVQRILRLVDRNDSGPDEGENVVQLPEHLLLQPNLIPLFTIRDPRLAVPSAYRVLQKFGLPSGGGRANFSVSTNPIWIRVLYNWFVAHGVEPVVVDCDDVQCAVSTDFLQRLCVRLGLVSEAVRLTWPRISDGEREATHPSFYISQSTLMESEGVDPALAARNRDLKKEEEGWETEFGDDVGLVREMVEQANVHYEWLMQRRFK